MIIRISEVKVAKIVWQSELIGNKQIVKKVGVNKNRVEEWGLNINTENVLVRDSVEGFC